MGLFSAIGAGASLLGAISGARKSRTPSAPAMPQHLITGANALGDLGGEARSFMGYGNDFARNVLGSNYRDGELYKEFSGFRGQIDDTFEGLEKDYFNNAVGSIPKWTEIATKTADDALSAGSDNRIAEARNRAYTDFRNAYTAQNKAQAHARAAAGLNPLTGQSALTDSFVASAAAGAMNRAGEDERRFGAQMRANLLPHAASAQQQAFQTAMLPMQMKLQTYALEADAINTALAPFQNVLGNTSNIYGMMVNAGAAQGNFALNAHNQQLKANQARRDAFGALPGAFGTFGGAWNDMGGWGGLTSLFGGK